MGALVRALVWATCIVMLVGWLGPQWLSRLGVSGWWAFVVPALAVLITLKAIAWSRRHADVEAVSP